MCDINGVKFDNTAFNDIFKAYKEAAIQASIVGCNKKGKAVEATASGAIGGAAATATVLGTMTTTAVTTTAVGTVGGVAMGSVSGTLITTTGIEAGMGLGASGIGTTVATGATVSTVPVVGWVVGGCILAAALVATILFATKDRSMCVLDTRNLIDGFTKGFQEHYTKWIEEQKNPEGANLT